MLVDGGILLYVGIGLRHIGLGLIVVVIADKILNRVVWKEVLELAVKLRCKRFVGSDNEGWTLGSRHHIGNSKGLSRPRHANQNLMLEPLLQPFGKGINGMVLITLRFKRRN